MLSFPIHHLKLLSLGILLIFTACSRLQPTLTVTEVPISANEEFPVQMNLLVLDNMMDENVLSEFDELADVSILQRKYSTDQELVTILEDQPEQASLISASNYAASLLIEKDLLSPLSLVNIPNLANLDNRFRNLPYDPDNQYCVPYAWGIVGIGYVNGQGTIPASWGDIFNLTLESPSFGRVSLPDDAREGLGAALIYLGYSANSTNDVEINQAKDLIIQNSGNFNGLDSISYGEKLALYQISFAQGFNREFLLNQQINPEVNFVVPSEGGIERIFSLCISKTASPGEKKAAEEFINLTLENQWAASMVFNLEIASTIKTADALIALDTRMNPLIYPTDEIINNAQLIQSLGTFELIYENAWAEIQAIIR
jgi:spermidine/putrescine transport system substrate-binding protein